MIIAFSPNYDPRCLKRHIFSEKIRDFSKRINYSCIPGLCVYPVGVAVITAARQAIPMNSFIVWNLNTREKIGNNGLEE